MAAKGFKVVSSEWANAPREQTWDAIIPVDLTGPFTGMKPFIPAIVGVQDQTGDWDAAGQTRRINLADGSHTGEKIESVDRPERFAYTVGPFSGAVGKVVDHVDGEFVFEEMNGGTFVRWSYTWVPRKGATPVVWLLSKIWRAYARRVLVDLVRLAGSSE